MITIRDVPAMPRPVLYTRSSGETYVKLNDQFHVRAERAPSGSLVGAGSAEMLDPDEEVTLA